MAGVSTSGSSPGADPHVTTSVKPCSTMKSASVATHVSTSPMMMCCEMRPSWRKTCLPPCPASSAKRPYTLHAVALGLAQRRPVPLGVVGDQHAADDADAVAVGIVPGLA